MQEQIHSGHRARMREKLLRYGTDIFETYELLEMLLYYSIPYRDTNPIAKKLLARFGTVDALFCAEKTELLALPDVGEKTAELIVQVGAFFMARMFLNSSDDIEYHNKWETGDLVGRYYGERKDPCITLFSFDNSMRLIGIDELYHCDYNSVSVRPEDFVRAAVARNAGSVVIAHNHPGSARLFDEGDRATDNLVRKALQAANIHYLSHLFINSYQAIPMDDGQYNLRAPALSAWNIGDDRKSAKTAMGLVERLFRAPYPNRAGQIAGKLFESFQYLSGIIERSPTALMNHAGLSEAEAVYLRVAIALNLRRITDAFRFGKAHSYDEIARYMCAQLVGRPNETVIALCVGDSGQILCCRPVSQGIVNSSGVLPRLLIDLCCENRASGVILAHNHPSGNAESSESDRITTSLLKQQLEIVGIRLCAHFVVAGFSYVDAVAEQIGYPEA